MAHDIEFVTVRETRIQTRRGGTGRPVLYLHGAGGIGGWLPFFETLAGHCHLIVPDHPGFGGSDDPKWLTNISDLAMFYLDFLEALGLDRVHLIGHSMGGWVAAELAVRDCSRLTGVTLMAPAGVRIKGIPTGDNFIWSPEEQAHNIFADPALAERMLAETPTPEQLEIALQNRFSATKFGWKPRWYDPDLEKWLHRIKRPVHLLWGDTDRLLPAAYAERWRALLPQARVTILEKCGHLPQIEKPAEAARHILADLAGEPV